MNGILTAPGPAAGNSSIRSRTPSGLVSSAYIEGQNKVVTFTSLRDFQSTMPILLMSLLGLSPRKEALRRRYHLCVPILPATYWFLILLSLTICRAQITQDSKLPHLRTTMVPMTPLRGRGTWSGYGSTTTKELKA